MLNRLVSDLSLTVDTVPSNSPFPFSAQRRDTDGYLLVELDIELQNEINEMSDWEKPSQHVKEMLLLCKSKIIIHYRGIELAEQCLLLINACLGETASKSLVENGRGCLLILADMARYITADASWSWERDEFPELDGVASSEWIE